MMIEKTFAEVSTGTKFSVNGLDYIKVDSVRVTCCQSINAHLADNPGARVFFQDSVVVTVNA
jgi:hypothetical protein